MKKIIITLFTTILLSVTFLDGKRQIDVSLRLADGLCEIVKKSVQSKVVDGNLKQTGAPPEDEGECIIWRWIKCDHNAPEPCSTWEKAPCMNGNDTESRTKGFCEIYQCGWTIDELFENWGYNPLLIHSDVADKPPNDELIVTGSTLDYPTNGI